MVAELLSTTYPDIVALPVARGGRLHCPRCATRLLREGDELACIACGYTFDPGDPHRRQALIVELRNEVAR